jgi:hypothetical protein
MHAQAHGRTSSSKCPDQRLDRSIALCHLVPVDKLEEGACSQRGKVGVAESTGFYQFHPGWISNHGWLGGTPHPWKTRVQQQGKLTHVVGPAVLHVQVLQTSQMATHGWRR